MRKIICAASAVLIGFAASAAVCNWETDSISSYIEAEGYSIWAFDTSSYAIATAMDDFAGGNFNFSLGTQGDIEGAEAAGTLGGYANGATANMYLVVFNNETSASATAAYFSDVETLALPSTGVAGTIAFDMSGSATASNWTTAAVPEPTSGLLILLGMAGLALKRKRA